jgi:nicotinate-nucleotide adenylyltransferase
MVRALFGGSFDPVHRGHVAVAAHLLNRGLADRVSVVPAGRSPHKTGTEAAARHRVEMCRLAFADLPGTTVDPRETRRGGSSYTVDTLREYREENPEDDLLLAVGADLLSGFSVWRRPDRILDLARLVVFPRDGVSATTEACAAANIPAERAILLEDFDHKVSSTEVRAILAEGRIPDSLLPPAVADYIRVNRLYGLPDPT